MSAGGTREPERVVLLDEAGRATGTHAKADVHHEQTPLHLAFSLYLFDDRGEDTRMLLTRRAWAKRTWPGVWTNSCCGHPAPGERLEEAVSRRAFDELGVAVRDLRVVLPAFRYRAVMDNGTVENEMCPVLVGRSADPDALDPDPAEVDDAVWVPWSAFRGDVLAGRREVSTWCALQVAALPADPLAAEPSCVGLPPAVQP